MHHVPSGPPPSARLVGVLAHGSLVLAGGLRGLTSLVRRSRIMPVVVLGLVLGTNALSTPASSVAGGRPDEPAVPAPLSAEPPADGLTPSTGDWTRDGAPVPVEDPAAPSDPATGSTGPGPTGPGPTGPGSSKAAPEDGDDATPAPQAAGTAAQDPPADATTTTPADPGPAPGPAAPSERSSAPSTPEQPTGTAGPTASTTTASTTTAPSRSRSGTAGAALALVDAERAAAGCAPLVRDDAFDAVADEHSDAMREQGTATLTGPDGDSLLERAGRRAAVAGGVTDPAAVVRDWLAFDREAVLDCSLTTAGVGSDGDWWTLLTA